MILQHETEQTHLLSDILARPERVPVTQIHRARRAARRFEPSLERVVVFEKRWMGKTGSLGSNRQLENGGQFKAPLFFLVHNKTRARGNLLWCDSTGRAADTCRWEKCFRLPRMTTFTSLLRKSYYLRELNERLLGPLHLRFPGNPTCTCVLIIVSHPSHESLHLSSICPAELIMPPL